MSRKVYGDIIISDVEVEHPFEPVLCKKQRCDILVFRDSNYGSVYDSSEILLLYKYGKIKFWELDEYGIYLVELFYDKGLLKTIFEYCKKFFEEHSDLYEYQLYYDRYITNYKGE